MAGFRTSSTRPFLFSSKELKDSFAAAKVSKCSRVKNYEYPDHGMKCENVDSGIIMVAYTIHQTHT